MLFPANGLPPTLFCITKRHGDVQAPSSVQSSSSYYRSLTHSDQRTAGYTDHLLVCSMVWFLSPKEGVPLQTKTRTVKSKPVLALQGSLKWSLQKNGATSNKFGRCKKLKRFSNNNQYEKLFNSPRTAWGETLLFWPSWNTQMIPLASDKRHSHLQCTMTTRNFPCSHHYNKINGAECSSELLPLFGSLGCKIN